MKRQPGHQNKVSDNSCQQQREPRRGLPARSETFGVPIRPGQIRSDRSKAFFV